MKFLEVERYTPISADNIDYVKELMEYCKNTPRHPKYHIHPPCGLLNDPNGLAFFNGKYHVFYQWFPFGPTHGMKHWAHVTSADLVNWEWSDEMLIPNQEYEKNGCYSGNAIQHEDKLYLFYTANYKEEYEGGTRKVPKQAVAIMDSDGSINKYEKNPVIDEQPQGIICEIRDPFVFKKNDAFWMLLGSGDVDRKAQVLLYKSENLLDWNYEGTLKITGIDFDFGYMFECPAYVEVDGKDVLTVSLMGKAPDGDRYHNEFSSIYLIGKLDLENKEFTVENYDEIDKGFDFYAPQSFYNKDGKPWMYGWFGCGAQELPYCKEDMWIHSLTMPRALSIKDGRLCQKVVDEVSDKYEVIEIEKARKTVSNTWYAKINDKSISEITIGSKEDYLKIELDWNTGIVSADRSGLKDKISEKYGERRSMQLNEGLSDVEIYYDNTFIELYINGGSATMTLRAFMSNMEIEAR